LKDRWAKIKLGMSKWREVPKKTTGCDDEVYDEFVKEVEQVWELFESWELKNESKKHKDAEEAIDTKAASLGKFGKKAAGEKEADGAKKVSLPFVASMLARSMRTRRP
jgi:LPS O-antigen subunit length determinant protein (WzzB/FepE family)